MHRAVVAAGSVHLYPLFRGPFADKEVGRGLDGQMYLLYQLPRLEVIL